MFEDQHPTLTPAALADIRAQLPEGLGEVTRRSPRRKAVLNR